MSQEIPAVTPETVETLIPIASPLIQVTGGQKYQINVQTTARQVAMSDGTDAETRISVLERAISGNTTVRFADTIEARDALAMLIPGDIVVVADASGDETVESGGARYIYLPDGAGFRKIGEDESLDLVSSWDNLEGRPDATAAQIDLAVARQHAHENRLTLDLLSTDTQGNLLFNGAAPRDPRVWVAAGASIADVPANLADNGLFIVNPAAGE